MDVASPRRIPLGEKLDRLVGPHVHKLHHAVAVFAAVGGPGAAAATDVNVRVVVVCHIVVTVVPHLPFSSIVAAKDVRVPVPEEIVYLNVVHERRQALALR